MKNSFARQILLRRDLLLLDTEEKSARGIRKAAFYAGAALCLGLAFLLLLFWMTVAIREAGFSAGRVGLGSFALFVLIAAALILAGRRGDASHESRQTDSRPQAP
jgi:hypothetical protein